MVLDLGEASVSGVENSRDEVPENVLLIDSVVLVLVKLLVLVTFGIDGLVIVEDALVSVEAGCLLRVLDPVISVVVDSSCPSSGPAIVISLVLIVAERMVAV